MRWFRAPDPPEPVEPGTMTVQHEPVKPRIHITRYNRRDLTETGASKVEQIREALAGDRVVWIDIQG
jgi:hypothetical protein